MLTVDDLHVSYGRKRVLQGVSMQVPPGEIVGLVSPNGMGKTTLLKAMTGLVRYRGRVDVDGITPRSKKRYFERVFFAESNRILLGNLTGLDHIAYIKSVWRSDEDVASLIDYLDIGHFVKKPVRSYSLGMKQQVVIALAAISGADYLLLDEPLNGLDPTNTKKASELFDALRDKGASVVLSSHMLGALDGNADRVLFLQAGRIGHERRSGEGAAPSLDLYGELYLGDAG